MDIVFLGLNDVGMKIYEWLCDRDGVQVQALLTTKDQLDLIEELDPELLVSVGFDHRVSSEILSIPTEGSINLHPSYLPYNRGKSPNVWSIVENTPAGVTLHYMSEQFDTGDIIARREVDTSFEDTGRDLHKRLEGAQFQLFTEVWPAIESGNVERTSQKPDKVTYHSIDDFRDLCEIKPEERYEAKELLDILRALTFPPFNNAYLEIDEKRFFVDVNIYREGEEKSETTDGFLSAY